MKLRYNKEDYLINYISTEDAIFHYTRRAVALEKILYENQFKFSYFENTNDPYEYKTKLIGAAGWGWDDAVEKMIYETIKALDKILVEQTLFIACCSNEFEERALISHGFLKSRMWSQYGENHEGVCLVFSKEKLKRLLLNKFESTEYVIWEGDVEYKEYINDDSGHDSLNIDNNTFDDNTPEKVAFMHLEKYYRELLFRKQSDYKDEQEYRVVMLRKNRHMIAATEPVFEVKDCLGGIILGDRFPKVYNPTIKTICKDMNILCKKLHWESGDYFLLDIK